MPLKKYRTALAAAAAAVSLPAIPTFAQLVSFPGAEGFGDLATGGRTGSVYVVTNLNDSGTGSFRDAVSASNRIVVFAVGGQVHLMTAVSAKSNITILGQTAPGDGFGVYGAEVSFFGQSNDIIQYMRFRDGTIDPGYKGSSTTSSSSSNCLNFGSSNNEIMSHVSAEFAAYNDVDANQATNFTAQDSIYADPIASQRFNFHQEGSPATFANNIFANGHNRAPLSKANAQYVNNVVYDYQAGFTAANSSGVFSYDVINNYFVAGPQTTSATDNFYQFDSNQSAYATGNLLDSNKDGALNGSADNSVSSANVLASPWSPATAHLPTLSAADAWTRDVSNAGDSLKHDATTYASSQGYDQVDSQVISDVESNGTSGSLWTSENQTGLSNGGFGVIMSGSIPTSSANNGIPDTWAITHGLSTTTTSAAMKLNALGYTMIEQYASEIADLNASQTWSASSGEWTANGTNWSSTLPGTYDHALIRGNGVSNGTVTVSNAGALCYSLSIGGNGPATGESMFMTAGSLTVYNTVTVGDQNNALLQITGGTLITGNVQLGNTVWDTGGNPTIYTGTLQLNGGILQTSEVVQGGGSPSSWTSGSVWSWGNGTLQAGPQGMNITAPAALTGSATLDTNGQSANMSGVLSGTGSLTKIGTGVATMIRTDSYSGGTIINAGALKAHTNGSFGSGTITINVVDGLQI
jgi:autotransporter-associated beta strand protein